MTKVFTVEVKSLNDGEFQVTLRNLSAEEFCSFQMRGETVQDLETALSDPRKPVFRRLRWSGISFYCQDYPAMDLQMPLCRLASQHCQMVMKQADADVWLQKFPDAGRFLNAVLNRKLTEDWDCLSKLPTVVPRQALCLVREVIREPAHPDSRQHFIQIFSKLTDALNGGRLVHRNHWLDQFFRTTKGLGALFQYLGQHWLELARYSATSLVTGDVSPVILPRRNWDGQYFDLAIALGTGFPCNFPKMLQRSILRNVLQTLTRTLQTWTHVSTALLSLDWCAREAESLETFEELMEGTRHEPDAFQFLQASELSQMVHVQLRLSCCGVAEVQGSISEVCMHMLAQLLRYKLKILAFESRDGLQDEIATGLLPDEEHRATLMVVTGVPSSCMHKISGGPHLLVLCYELDDAPALHARDEWVDINFCFDNGPDAAA